MMPDELRDFLNQKRVKFKEKEVQSGRQFKCEARRSLCCV
jgi:hypothetical protein